MTRPRLSARTEARNRGRHRHAISRRPRSRQHAPVCSSAAERFATLRVALHQGLPVPPEWWPDAQQRILRAADEYERAFLTLSHWLRAWRARQGRAA